MTKHVVGVQPLNGQWRLALDPENRGRQDSWFGGDPPVPSTMVAVPGAFQAAFPGQHGVAWYWHTFDPARALTAGERALLRFHAIDYLGEVWLNSTYVGRHEGGETPFTLDVTAALRPGENLLAVRVLNPTKVPIDGIVLGQTPHRNKMMDEDFNPGNGLNWGGIVESVQFLTVPAVYIGDICARPDWQSGHIRLTLTLHNHSDSAAQVQMTLTAGPTQDGRVLAAATLSAEAAVGETLHSTTLLLPNHRLWSLEEPTLYRVEAAVEATTSDGTRYQHEQAVRCGFRDFRVEGGYFRLNGKRLFVRSTHTGNHYPIGFYGPVDPDLVRRDLIYAKVAGFSMVRFITRVALPEQLDFCDEIGLLVYEEEYAGWKLENSPRMNEVFDLSLREMILRDRNHPSVVLWGLLNETLDGAVFRRAAGSLPLIRELDPTRTVMLSSGRWDHDLSIGSVSNPGSARWEPVWGREGDGNDAPPSTPRMPRDRGQPAYVDGAGDIHVYPRMPQDEATQAFLRTLGQDSKPVFLSEYGIGSLLDVIHILGRYQQTSHIPLPDDVAIFKTMRDQLEADWTRFGMETVYPFPRDLLRESQRLHSRQRLLGLNLIRSNPQIAGYNLTGMLDHGYTGEGVWTFWREWKPGVVDALQDGFAPLRWCLFVTPPHTYAGRPITVEVVLANEDVLRSGDYPTRLAIWGPAGRMWEQTVHARIPAPAAGQDPPLATPVFKEELEVQGPVGSYVLAAHMEQGGSPEGDRLAFYVADPSALPTVQGQVTVWGLDERATAWLTGRGLHCRPFGAHQSTTRQVILVGDLSTMATSAEEWRALAEQMARGSTVLFLSPRAFRRGEDAVGWLPLASKGRCHEFSNWLYHREDVAKPHPIFAGLPAPGILDWDYWGPVIPRYVFEGQPTPDDIAAVFFTTGYASMVMKVKSGYAAGLITAGYAFGAGRFLLNSLQILENVDQHPAADRVLLNLITYATTMTAGPLEPLPDDFDALLSAIGYHP